MVNRPSIRNTRLFGAIEPSDDEASTYGIPNTLADSLNLTALRFSSVKWRSGWNMSSDEILAFLLLLRQYAIRSELKGQWVRADFYWNRVAQTLRRCWDNDEVWTRVRQDMNVEEPVQEDIRLIFVDETLIDVHLALLSGLMSDGPTTNSIRGVNRQLKLVEVWSDKSSMNRAQLCNFQVSLFANVTAWLIDADRLGDAVDAAERWLARATTRDSIMFERAGEIAGVLAQLYFSKIIRLFGGRNLADIPAADLAAILKDVKSSARDIESLVSKYPGSFLCYQCLGEAYRLMSLVENILMLYADALLHLAMASKCLPNWMQYEDFRVQLQQNLSEAAAQLAALEQQIRVRPGATLSPEAAALKIQVKRGSKPAESYVSSQPAAAREAGALRAARLAIATTLGVNGEALEEAQLSVMVDSMNEAARRMTAESRKPDDNLYELWMECAAANELELTDEQHACAVVALLNVSSGELRMDPSAPVQALNDPYVIRVPGKTNEDPTTALSPCAPPTREKSEPFLMWLFSSEGLMAKAFVIAGIAALVLGSSLWYAESQVLLARHTLFEQIASSSPQDSPVTVITAADEFLSAEPRVPDLERISLVTERYRESFSQWIALNASDDEQALEELLDTYVDDLARIRSEGLFHD